MNSIEDTLNGEISTSVSQTDQNGQQGSRLMELTEGQDGTCG